MNKDNKLFDLLKCKMTLPLPSELFELKDVDWTSAVFQTKDLIKSLNLYEIREDKKLYISENTNENIKENSTWETLNWKPSDITSTFTFYTFIDDEDFNEDFWVEFSAIVKNGIVENIKLERFEHWNRKKRKIVNDWFDKVLDKVYGEKIKHYLRIVDQEIQRKFSAKILNMQEKLLDV